MQEAQRLNWFTSAALLLLLFMTAFGNAWMLAATALTLLAGGFVLLPRYRTRGLLAALVAAVMAALALAALRLFVE